MLAYVCARCSVCARVKQCLDTDVNCVRDTIRSCLRDSVHRIELNVLVLLLDLLYVCDASHVQLPQELRSVMRFQLQLVAYFPCALHSESCVLDLGLHRLAHQL